MLRPPDSAAQRQTALPWCRWGVGVGPLLSEASLNRLLSDLAACMALPEHLSLSAWLNVLGPLLPVEPPHQREVGHVRIPALHSLLLRLHRLRCLLERFAFLAGRCLPRLEQLPAPITHQPLRDRHGPAAVQV